MVEISSVDKEKSCQQTNQGIQWDFVFPVWAIIDNTSIMNLASLLARDTAGD